MKKNSNTKYPRVDGEILRLVEKFRDFGAEWGGGFAQRVYVYVYIFHQSPLDKHSAPGDVLTLNGLHFGRIKFPNYNRMGVLLKADKTATRYRLIEQGLDEMILKCEQ